MTDDDRSAAWKPLHAETLSYLSVPAEWTPLGIASWSRVDEEIRSLKSAFEKGELAEAQEAYARLLELTSPPMARPALTGEPEPEQLTGAPADTLALIDTFIKDVSVRPPGSPQHPSPSDPGLDG
ncbi:hypothetical protein ACWC3X_17880 [Streptomyces populi]